MTVIKSVTYKGQNKTDTLTSKIRIEDGNGRLVLYDGTYLRLILGILPNGVVGLAIGKPGQDVTDAFS